jgi:hypothetical protein
MFNRMRRRTAISADLAALERGSRRSAARAKNGQVHFLGVRK